MEGGGDHGDPGGDLGSLLLQKALCSPTLMSFCSGDFLGKSFLTKLSIKPSFWRKYRFIHLNAIGIDLENTLGLSFLPHI